MDLVKEINQVHALVLHKYLVNILAEYGNNCLLFF